MSALRILSAPPPNLLNIAPRDLAKTLGGPTLIHFRGKQGRAPLAVVALLHGNETSGWTTMARFLKKHPDGMLPRPLMLLVGNVRAAADGVRFLPDGADWNRVWGGRGGVNSTIPEMAFARAAMDEFKRAKIWAGVDLHNNTGRNPLYAAIFRDARRRHSARMAAGFSGVVVETAMPRGTCMQALSTLAPSATLECGTPGSPDGIDRAVKFLAALSARETLPDADPKKILRTVAKVKLPPRHSVDFGKNDAADIVIPADVERWNFKRLAGGFIFARLRDGLSASAKFPVVDEDGGDVFARYFSIDDGEVKTARPFIPAMLVADEKAARNDCLCYIMEEG